MSDFPNSIRLPTPVRITEQVWPEWTVPVVSVFCITYNHVNFIRDAIEGFLMQETTFPVEIFIHDDASTDGTAEIVKEYAEKYPKLFWTVLQTENQWSKGNKKILTDYLQKQRGEFIALCEGDDYWISKEKLQKQVEIMQNDRSVSLCFHNTWVMHPCRSGNDYFLNYGIKQNTFDLKDILFKNWFIATSSILCRKKTLDGASDFNFACSGDLVIHALAALRGVIVFLDEVCSVYRIHSGGISYEWHRSNKIGKEKMRANHFWMYFFLSKKFSNNDSKSLFQITLENIVRELAGYFSDQIDTKEIGFEQSLQKSIFQCLENQNPRKGEHCMYDALSKKWFQKLVRNTLRHKLEKEIHICLNLNKINDAITISIHANFSKIVSWKSSLTIFCEFLQKKMIRNFSLRGLKKAILCLRFILTRNSGGSSR